MNAATQVSIDQAMELGHRYLQTRQREAASPSPRATSSRF
jgi:hypothetical protein